MIDYSAFDEKNINQYNGKLPGLPRLSTPMTGLIIVAVALLIILTPILSNVSNGYYKILVIIAAIYLAYRLTWNGKKSCVQTALFAKRNGFNYSLKGGKFKAVEGMGSVLGEPMMSNVVTGKLRGQNFTLCGIYGGKLYKNVLRVTLPNNYPQIILDSKQNDTITSSLHEFFPKSKEIDLEGDFPKYFRLFTATNPIDTLQIMSPDLMARMVDYANKADIEILSNHLLLICKFKYIDKEIYQMLFEAAEQILKDIGVNSNNSTVKFDSTSRV